MNLKEMNEIFMNCSCGREHTCPVETVKIGFGVLLKLTELCKSYTNILIVSDENTYKVCGEKVYNLLVKKVDVNLIFKSQGKVVVPNEESIAVIEKALNNNTDLIIGVGSGVINDLCKYVSFYHNLPYYIVATAPSMDGYASVGAAMILNGMKFTVNARPPKAIIGDTEILKDAPFDMLQAGYGDIIGKFSCLNDWKISALINNEYFCERVYDVTLDCAKTMTTLAEGIKERDEKTVEILMEALVKVGILMSYVNSSRPASGSEHHLSHFFEITGLLEGKEYFAHGIDVVFSSFYTQKIREDLLNMETSISYNAIQIDEYEQKIKSIYDSLSDEVIALQNKKGWYKENRSEAYKAKWSEIKSILAESPSSLDMEKYINQIGLNINDFEKLYGKNKIQNAIWFAKDLKDRYTVLWMNFDLKYKNQEEKMIIHNSGITVAAHRGDSYNFYENTMRAFEMAIEKGADMIETDVRLTKDNVLVLVHDDSLLRTGKADVKISNLMYDELQNYNVGDLHNFETVPKLEDLLEMLKGKGVMLNLEIKENCNNGNIERCNYCIDKCVELIEKYQMADNMVFNSFDAYVLEYIYKKYKGKYMLHGFYPYSIMRNVQINPDEYLYCACVFDDKNKECYDYLTSKGIETWVGAGVTISEHLKLCVEYGAKLITTNNPLDILRKIEEKGIRK